MKRMRKVLSLLVLLVMAASIAFTGCGSGNAGTPDGTSAAGTSGAGGTTKEEGTTATAEPKIKLTMFMGNSGLAHPDGVDPSDNPWINIIENYANVDLEVEVPGYQDYKTKLELLLSSGNLPDIVHSYVTTSSYKFADQGAFIDLKKYYDNSEPIKKYISEEMMEVSKSASGHYYRIPMKADSGPMGAGVVARWDLVKKYNNNQWPTSVDEWLAVFRTMHKAEPESVVLSNRVRGSMGITFAGVPIYFWYGAVPYGSRYDFGTGKVVNNFVLPEYKAATEVMRQMYKEGILDKEFATNDDAKYGDRMHNKNTIVNYNGVDQHTPEAQVNARLGKDNPASKVWEWVFAPPLTTYPKELQDPIYAQAFMGSGIGIHGLYISSKCKSPDRAWKVIEGFALDELYEAVFWGKEGQEYTVQDGKRIPDPEKLRDPSRAWSTHLALVFGFTAGQDVKKAVGELGCGKEYSDMVWDSINVIDQMTRKNGVSPLLFTTYSEEVTKKSAESQNFITQATVEAIVGKITMEQFDQRVKEYQDKYGFIADEDTKYIAEHKAELEKMGVIFNR